MTDTLPCPSCGRSLRKGSTFCIKCGSRLTTDGELLAGPLADPVPEEPTLGESSELEEDVIGTLSQDGSMRAEEEIPADLSELDDFAEVLPPIDEAELPKTDLESAVIPEKPDDEIQPVAGLSWDSDEALEGTETLEEPGLIDTELPPAIGTEPDTPPPDPPHEGLSWAEGITEETDPSDVKEGDPFREVEPPRIVDEPTMAPIHLAVDEHDEETRDAVGHLFPAGRGVTGGDFIDAVVGTAKKISVRAHSMKEVESPTCPSCGLALTSDDFSYPPYVYEAMGQARIEHGEAKIRDAEFELAIESFEKAKILYERSGLQKHIDETNRRIDHAYEDMADYHFEQGEKHQREHQYEWAIVQFQKARQIFMFTTRSKKRAKCAEKVRDCYIDWGKMIEDEGDLMVKTGKTRAALSKYQEAAEKYRKGDDPKKLRGLEKKIRKA